MSLFLWTWIIMYFHDLNSVYSLYNLLFIIFINSRVLYSVEEST